MSEGGGGKKSTAPEKKKAPRKSKKPKSFTQFWNRLVKRDKSKSKSEGMPTERTVKRAVAKAAKNLHLKKDEQQQVTQVLAAELQRRTCEQTETPPHPEQVKPGDSAYPMAVNEGLFAEKSLSITEESRTAELAYSQVDQRQLEEARKKALMDLESQRKSLLMRSASTSGGQFNPQPFGSQPSSIMLDANAAKEVRSHTMVHMLRQFMLDSAKSRREAATAKRPEDMNPDELVELRRRDPNAWDALVRENTVVSYALTKPRPDDQEQTKKAQRRPLQFDDRVEVNKAPVGKDFFHNEKKTNENGSLKRN